MCIVDDKVTRGQGDKVKKAPLFHLVTLSPCHPLIPLSDPLLPELRHHALGDLAHFVITAARRITLTDGAAIRRRVDHAEVAHDALQAVLEFLAIDALLFAEGLTTAAEIEASQFRRGTKAFGEVGAE